MSPVPPAHLATVFRGDAPETVVRGHVVVAGPAGEVLAAVGDPDSVTTLRSCVKPVQALPFVRRAVDRLGITAAEIAVACASHNGESAHVNTVSGLLSRAALSSDALSCGPQLPYDDEATREAISSGVGARKITNNCSGKHAAMLVTCVAAGWPIAGYADFDHPLQAEIRSIMSDFGGLDLNRQPYGIDGCGLPTHGVPLRFLARAFAAAARDPDFERCQDAMAAQPHMVAGRGRFDTALLTAAGDRVTGKGGGAAVWAAVRRPRGPGLAIKLEAGDAAWLPAIALAALSALGWLDGATSALPELQAYSRAVLHNWAGAAVGGVSVEPAWVRSVGG